MSFSRRRSIRLGLAGVVGLALHVAPASAQAQTWTAPTSGYIYDAATRSIRPVTGFVGSSILGPSIVDGIDWAALAPNQKSALVQRGGSLVWIADLATPDRSQTLDQLPLARLAFWASDSTRVVLLTEDSQLIWLTSLDSSPTSEAAWRLDTLVPAAPSGDPASWSLLAADSSADRVLLAVSAADGPQPWIASRAAPPAALPLSLHPVAAVFAPGTPSAFVADASSHQVFQLQGLDRAPSATSILSSDIYVNDPAGIVLSTDGGRFFLADRSTATLRVFDSTSGALLDELLADAPPQSLTAVSSGRFLLEPADTGSSAPSPPPLLFLITADPARVLFVPRGN
jgi:DNA-binding beta-propeller fold protein YncE